MHRIRDEAWNCFEEEEQIADCFVDYFEGLFSLGNNYDMLHVLNLVESRINDEMS